MTAEPEDAEYAADPRYPIKWSRADELAYQAAAGRVRTALRARLNLVLAEAEMREVSGPTRTGPGASAPQLLSVTPPPARPGPGYRPNSPACGRNRINASGAGRPRIDPKYDWSDDNEGSTSKTLFWDRRAA